MSAGAIRQSPELREALAQVQAERENEREQTFQDAIDALMRRAREEDAGLREHWESPSQPDGDWSSITLPEKVQTLWKGINGVYWFRKEIEIPAEWEGKDLTLSLGPVDDADETWWNGEEVGSGSVWTCRASILCPETWSRRAGMS